MLKRRSADQELDPRDSAPAMSDAVERQQYTRRKQQDYTGFEDTLPVSVWENMRRANNLRGRTDALCGFLHSMGLRSPTERTLANMTAMLGMCESIQPGEDKFQLRRILENLRTVWKTWSSRATAHVDTDLQLAKLPANLEDFPPALRERLQAETLCSPDTFDRGEVQRMASRVPLRSTNLGYHLEMQQREFFATALHYALGGSLSLWHPLKDGAACGRCRRTSNFGL